MTKPPAVNARRLGCAEPTFELDRDLLSAPIRGKLVVEVNPTCSNCGHKYYRHAGEDTVCLGARLAHRCPVRCREFELAAVVEVLP